MMMPSRAPRRTPRRRRAGKPPDHHQCHDGPPALKAVVPKKAGQPRGILRGEPQTRNSIPKTSARRDPAQRRPRPNRRRRRNFIHGVRLSAHTPSRRPRRRTTWTAPRNSIFPVLLRSQAQATITPQRAAAGAERLGPALGGEPHHGRTARRPGRRRGPSSVPTPSTAWAGRSGEIAVCQDGGWTFYAPGLARLVGG